MKIEKVLETALVLIKDGKKKLPVEIKSGKYTKHFPFPEYYIQYSETLKLLLSHFSEKTDNKIQEFINKNIPKPPEYIENEIHFNELYDIDKNTRIKAAKYFSKIARQEKSGYLEFPFSYPKTFERLFPALNDEEPKVVRDIIIALGAAYSRHFQDYRVFPKLFQFYNSKNKILVKYSIGWTSSMENDMKYDTLLNLLTPKQNSDTIWAICNHFNKKSPTEKKIILQKKLTYILDNKNRISKYIKPKIERKIIECNEA